MRIILSSSGNCGIYCMLESLIFFFQFSRIATLHGLPESGLATYWPRMIFVGSNTNVQLFFIISSDICLVQSNGCMCGLKHYFLSANNIPDGTDPIFITITNQIKRSPTLTSLETEIINKTACAPWMIPLEEENLIEDESYCHVTGH